MGKRFRWAIVVVLLTLTFVASTQLYATQTSYRGADILVLIDRSISMGWNDTGDLRRTLPLDILVELQAQSRPTEPERRLYRFGILGFTDQPISLLALRDVVQIGEQDISQIAFDTENKDSDFYNVLNEVLRQHDASSDTNLEAQVKTIILITDGELDVAGPAGSASPSNRAYFGAGESYYLREGSLSALIREFDERKIQLFVVLTRTEADLENPPPNHTLRFWSEILADDRLLPPNEEIVKDRIFARMVPDQWTPNLITPQATRNTSPPTPFDPLPTNSATTTYTTLPTTTETAFPSSTPTYTHTNTPTPTATPTETGPIILFPECNSPTPPLWCDPLVLVSMIIGVGVVLAVVLFGILRIFGIGFIGSKPPLPADSSENWHEREIKKIQGRLGHEFSTLLEECTTIRNLAMLQEANFRHGEDISSWKANHRDVSAKRIWTRALEKQNLLGFSNFGNVENSQFTQILARDFERRAFLFALVGHIKGKPSVDWRAYLNTLNEITNGKEIISILANENEKRVLQSHIGPTSTDKSKLTDLQTIAKAFRVAG